MSRKSPDYYDVTVVGAGPVGAVTALAFAKKGARVGLLEAQPKAKDRFAGEWLHPAGVAVLDHLRVGRLERARPRTGYGFVLFTDDGGDPVELPYKNGVALSAEHGDIVDALREIASAEPLIDYLPHHRASNIRQNAVDVCKSGGQTRTLHTGQIVGADGRKSVVRRSIDLKGVSTPMSHMAAVVLRGVTLPREGFGHVILGGPGPMLVYRISDDEVRVSMDVPLEYGPGARTPASVWQAFGNVIPGQLRSGFRAALEAGTLTWAVNRFRPRSGFGEGSISLVGDSVGHVHPMTAIGMTQGFKDAIALTTASGLEEYGKERQAVVPELLANALYHCFQRTDKSAVAMRTTMFRVLRSDPRERERTMRIMCGDEPRTSQFISAFLRVAREAGMSLVQDGLREGQLTSLPGNLRQYAEWLQWPLASFVSGATQRYRHEAKSDAPIGPLAGLFFRKPDVDASAGASAGRPGAAPVVTAARKATIDRFIRELVRTAMRYGKVPDEDLLRPSLFMVRSILAGPTRKSVSSRMEFGRKRIRVEGLRKMLRLVERGQCGTQDLCEGLLIVAPRFQADPTREERSAVDIPAVVRAILSQQIERGQRRGGFVEAFQGTLAEAPAVSESANLVTTALVCRTFAAVRPLLSLTLVSECDRAVVAAATWATRVQDAPGKASVDPALDELSTAALTAIVQATHSPCDPGVRRACSLIASEALSSELPLLTRARVVTALVVSRSIHNQVLHECVGALASTLFGDCDAPLMEQAAALEAISLYDLHRSRSTTKSAPNKKPSGASTEDLAYVRSALEAVSRTFSKPIALLPPPLDQVVSVGYLLCRIADTFEDHPSVPDEVRGPGLTAFLSLLAGEGDVAAVVEALACVDESDAELDLVRELETVMRVYATFDSHSKESLTRWVSEMARGMQLYCARRGGTDGVRALHTLEDLERYCYFVAGTVGHLLTDLFIQRIPGENTAAALVLRENAEAFGMGLQLTNILKDVTDDDARSVSFIPRTVVGRSAEDHRGGAEVLGPRSLLCPTARPQAHRAVKPIFESARGLLDRGLLYALTIPASETGIRLFCLLPLFMAARTLLMAEGNDAMFVPGAAVKISREEVTVIIELCSEHVGDDAALRGIYASLWDKEHTLTNRAVVSSLRMTSA